jgi:triosephosphate isomerase
VADNTAAFLSRPGIDGALVGGASLKADEFLAVVRAAIEETQAEMQMA